MTFGSAASLQETVNGDCVDLSERFVITIDNCDNDSDSLGDSIESRFNLFSHLVQCESVSEVNRSNYLFCAT
jgi:hypothetical protein